MTYNPDAPKYGVTSTLRVYDEGDEYRPTMPNWANIALSVLADKTLTRGQIATEVMLFDRNRDKYDIGDELTAAEDALVDALNAQLSVDVDDEVDAIESANVDGVREEWVSWVNSTDSYINPKGNEQQITTRGEADAERCGFYRIDELTPDVHGLGRSLAESLGKLMASPWSSRADRLGDLQTLQTVLAAGSWQVVDDDQDTTFVQAVRNHEESEWPVGTLAAAVDSSLSHSKSADTAGNAVAGETDAVDDDEDESEFEGLEVEDGKVEVVTADVIDPKVVDDLVIKQRSDLREDLLAACARYKVQRGDSLRGPSNIGSRRDLLDTVLDSSNKHYLNKYRDAITSAAADATEDDMVLNVQSIIDTVLDHNDVDRSDIDWTEDYDVSVPVDDAKDMLDPGASFDASSSGYSELAVVFENLGEVDSSQLAALESQSQ